MIPWSNAAAVSPWNYWRAFMTMWSIILSATVCVTLFQLLYHPDCVNSCIQDLSEHRLCCKPCVHNKFQKGFTLLTLGWSDGYSFIPTGFNMLSSASKSNRYNEASDTIDRRTNGYKFRKESMMRKTDAAIQLISNALAAGIKADYVLMDTWFTTEPMLREILKTGLDAIGMVKQLKQRYTCRGRQYTLPELKLYPSDQPSVRSVKPFWNLCSTWS